MSSRRLCSIPRWALILAYRAVPVRFLSSRYGICCLVLLSRYFLAKPKSIRNTCQQIYWVTCKYLYKLFQIQNTSTRCSCIYYNVNMTLTLLQCRPIPIRKLSGFISRWMKFLLWTNSILFIIWKTKHTSYMLQFYKSLVFSFHTWWHTVTKHPVLHHIRKHRMNNHL